MRLTELLQHLHSHVQQLLTRADHPEAGLSPARRAFVFEVITALLMTGSVLVTQVVRSFPMSVVAMKHRYKNADRLLGLIDFVALAAEQTEVLGRRVGPGWAIPIDLSCINKAGARRMEGLYRVRDGTDGEIKNGFVLLTAGAIDAAGARKALPLPLIFDVHSTAVDDFKSQTALWLEGIDRVCASTPSGTLVIDREGDNGKLLTRIADTHHRDFVVRMNAGNSSRTVVYDAGTHQRVRDAWKVAKALGELEATRLCQDGKRKPYLADVSAMEVRVPCVKRRLWMVAFDCTDHLQPMVLLTTRPVSTLAEAAEVLALYFARWSEEELHRFAKQTFDLDDIRTLTWHRTQNLVAAVAIAMGVLALLPQRTDAEPVLRDLELRGQRVRKPLREEQFWGYTLAAGVASILSSGRRLLQALPWYRHVPDPERDRQPCLPGLGA